MSLADDILAAMPTGTARVVPITCVSVSPFQVSIAGTASWVPAKRISGQTFELGDKGVALWSPPLAPYCFKTS